MFELYWNYITVISLPEISRNQRELSHKMETSNISILPTRGITMAGLVSPINPDIQAMRRS